MSTKEERERIELLQGTLDLLILRTLLLGPRHGHAIAKAIELNSEDVLQVEQGLYPTLHRLIKRRWITVEAGTSHRVGIVHRDLKPGRRVFRDLLPDLTTSRPPIGCQPGGSDQESER